MSNREKLIRFALLCIHSKSFNRIASKEDRLLFADLILKTAVSKGMFEDMAPFITQAMVIGAQGDFKSTNERSVERVTLSGTDRVKLKNPDVDQSSVKVMGEDGEEYTTSDYVSTNNGAITTISRTEDSRIMDGERVVIEYVYKDNVLKDSKRHALASLQLMFNYEPKKRFSRDPSESEIALDKLTKGMKRFLGGKYAQLVKVYGVDALEDAYAKLMTEQDGFGEAMILSAGGDLDKSSLTSLGKTMAGKIASIILGDVKDYVIVQKGRKNIQDSLKPEEDFDGDSVDSLLSREPALKMVDAIKGMDEIFEKEGQKLLKSALSTLKVSSVLKADLFMQASRGCGTLQTPSKLAPAVREDLLALCMILPFHYGITENTRKPRVKKTVEAFKVEVFGQPDPMGLFPSQSQSDVVDVIRQIFRDAGSSYVPHAPRSLATYIENAKIDSLAKSVSNYIDQTYLILLNRLLKLELGMTNVLSNECAQALVTISDRSELGKVKYKMDPKGIVFTKYNAPVERS